MDYLHRIRGRFRPMWPILLTLIAHAPLAAEPLPLPCGEVVLVIDGAIAHTNIDGEARFDLAMLQGLPAHAFTTDTPWHEGPQRFEGVLLSALLERVGAASSSFQAEAVDDYTATFSGIDLKRYPVIVAYRHGGEPMTRRRLGPLRIVMPFDDHPSLRTYVGEALSVWQLLRMRVL